MKAIEIAGPGGLDQLRLRTRKRPKPAANEVLVRWRATSLNYHDYLVAVGAIPVAPGRVPMSDGAGEVVALGESVTRWKKGDRVMSLFFPLWLSGAASASNTAQISGENIDGYASEFGTVSETALTRMPEHLDFAEAATLPCAGLTAWRALVEEGKLKAGEIVLVQGSGGVSIFALQIARAMNARVIATTSNPSKAKRLQRLGAEKVIDYKKDESWGKTVRDLSGGGVDHVLDVGGATTMAQSVEAIGFNGKIYSIGILGGRGGSFVYPKLFFKHASIKGIAVGSRRMQERMVEAVESAGIRPAMDKSFRLGNLADAFRYQESGKHFGKIVVQW